MPIDLTDTITRLLTLDVVCSSSWNFQSLIHVIYRRAVLNTHHLQPKFVVSRRLQFSKGFWVFLFCPWNHLSGGGVHANHNALHLPCFTRKNKTANDSKLLNNSKGNRDGEWNFCRWEGARHCFIHTSGVDIHEKDKKSLRTKWVNYCLKQDDHRNKQNGSKSTNQKPLPFWTHSSKHLFPNWEVR